MKKNRCVVCDKVTARRDIDNTAYCSEHMHLSNKLEKKYPRVSIPDTLYYPLASLAASKKMTPHKFIVSALKEEIEKDNNNKINR